MNIETPTQGHAPNISKPPSKPIENSKEAFRQRELGRIMSVGSSHVYISINSKLITENKLNLVELGSILKIITRDSIVVAMVASLKIGDQDGQGENNKCFANLNILGEINTNKTTRETRFFRGVRNFPVLGEAVYNMSSSELELIFNQEKKAQIDVGLLHQDSAITARVRTDDLLSKHFAIIGSTGSGKSCTVALVLQAILRENRNAHILLFDPHNEYSHSFGSLAEVVHQDTMDLPLWLFNFEETVEVLTSEVEDHRREEVQILHDIILKAKIMYERSSASGKVSVDSNVEDAQLEGVRTSRHISLDSPVQYRIRDVLKLLKFEMGKLENSNNIPPYRRLTRRIDQLLSDPRYQFMFKNQASPTPIEDVVGQLFRIPVNNKPISIIDMSAVPSEMMNIVVSVVSRLAFDIAMWSNRKLPILLVCEEAHRYIPRDSSLGFNSTRKAISRIAKEGRKYGVSLAIISQRPSELEPSTLSQCNTIFSMRLSNEVDQNFVRAAVPDGSKELLNFLPSLGTAEAMVFGEAVSMPMRVILNSLPKQYQPKSSSASFTELWQHDNADTYFMQSLFQSWRTREYVSPEVLKRDNGGSDSVGSKPYNSSHSPVAHQGSHHSRPPVAAPQANMSQAQPDPGLQPRQGISDVRRIINNAFNSM